MPELPDLAIVVEAFHAVLTGRPVTSASAPGPLAVRGTPAELQALVGQSIRSVRRRGKFVVLAFDRDAVVVNAMLSGRFQLAVPDATRPARAAVILGFGSREGQPPSAAAWTRDAPWMPADTVATEMRFRDATQMGKVYLIPADVHRTVPGLDATLGPDADDRALTIELWRERIRAHAGELKPLLRQQTLVAGIGNAYSDEILHAARLSPFRKRSSLAAEEIDELYDAMRRTLAGAIETLRRRVPPKFETEVRDFLAVHRKGGEPCPRCGTRISEVFSRREATSWCRGCQR